MQIIINYCFVYFSTIAVLCVLVVGTVLIWHLRQGRKTYDDEKLALVDTHVAQTKKSYLHMASTSPRQTVSHSLSDGFSKYGGMKRCSVLYPIREENEHLCKRRGHTTWNTFNIQSLFYFLKYLHFDDKARYVSLIKVLVYGALSCNESQLKSS